MNVIVTTTMCEVDNNTSMNSGEYNINKLHFTFSSAYLNEYVKKALFTIADGTAVEMVIENNECQIPNEVLRNPGTYLLGVYAYSIENNELILRYSPKPTSIYVNKGSYIENVVSPTTPTPDEFEQYYQAMQLLLTKAANKITLEINDSTYKLKAKLFDRNDNLLSESNEIDLPMENAVNNGTYDNENKKIVLTQINGETIDIPIDGILIETVDKITLEINNDTYKLKAKLFDRENQLISESNEIDLPMENAVNNGTYDNENKKIVLTQINGETIDIPIGTLINGLAYQNDVDTALDTKVDKVEGKQLSTNDFTNALKTKLDGIEDSADVNIIESISKNGTSLTITNKNVNIEVPTKTSDITNDSGFITKSVNNLTNYTTTSDMNTAISNAVGTETTNRENADVSLQSQIDAITSSSDVVDIVGTYAELQNYDTSTLTNDDVIKVLQDSTHNNALSYYRWTIVSRVGSWVYIGSEGPFYTKGETDTLLNTKYDKPTNGIPKTDLESAVQTSLGKADTAIQSSDLTNYVTKTDYATDSVGGVIKISTGTYGSNIINGFLCASQTSYENYQNKEPQFIIGKGTLENIMTGKKLETANNKVTSIDENSTDTEYPSAKCIYNSQEIQDERINDTNEDIELLKKTYNVFPTVSNQAEKITLDGTAEVQFKNFELKGNTSQNTTQGNQLLDFSNPTAYTAGGIYTFTNDILTFSTTSSDGTYTNARFDVTDLYKNNPGKTLKFVFDSIDITNYGSRAIVLLAVTYSDSTSATYSGLVDDTGVSSPGVAIPSDTSNVETANVRIYTNNANTTGDYSISITKPMLQFGTETKNYEIFTGGQSPNPDYPQDIQVVTGDNSIKVEGKNLFNLKDTYYKRLDTGSVTTNDNNIKVENVNTAAHQFIWWNIPVKIGEPITISYNSLTESTTDNNNGVFYTFNDEPYTSFVSFEVFSKVDKTNKYVTTTATKEYLVIGLRNVPSCTNICSKLQVELGSAVSEYQEFQGNQIYSVNLPVKNLFDNSLMIEWGNTIRYIPVNVDKNTDYTLSTSNPGQSAASANVFLSTSNSSVTSNANGVWNNKPRTINSGDNNVIYVAYRGNIEEKTQYWYQLEKGAKANHYTPYGTTPMELCKIGNYQDVIKKSTGKNLFNKNDVNSLQAIPYENTISSSNNGKTLWIACKPNTTYTISKIISTRFQIFTTQVTPNINVAYSNYQNDATASSLTITTGDNDYYLCVYYYHTSDTLTEQQILDSIMINEGSTVLPYEPYGKVWYKYGTIGKVVLDGSENWNLQSINSYGIANFLFVNNISDYIGGSVNRGTMCNYFLAQNSLISATKTPGYMLNPGKQLFLRINSSIVNTTETFKTWLSTHNTIIYYALATPTITEITDNTLIGQLNALEKAYSYDTQTNISQINADKPFIINTEAILSLKSVLDIEDELTTLDIGNGVD